jgi:hypothetical protein
MKWTRDWLNILSLSEAIKHLESGSPPKRPLCITFDDGYADNDSVALQILRTLWIDGDLLRRRYRLSNRVRTWNDAVIESIRLTPRWALGLGLAQKGFGRRDSTRAGERHEYSVAHLFRLQSGDR